MSRLAAEPGPEANRRGSSPSMKASDVITIGRKRSLAAVRAACTASTPLSTSSLANSTMRMAFFATRPTSITRPIWKYMLFSSPHIHIPRYAPIPAIGRDSITAMGTLQLSYWAARNRNTNRNASPSTSPVLPFSCFSWYDSPLHSTPMFSGSLVLTISSRADIACPVL